MNLFSRLRASSSQRYILVAILLLAAFLRFWRLDTLPPGLHHDEAYNGLDALSLLEGKQFPQFYEGWELYGQDAHAGNPPQETRFPLFFEGNYGREALHVYLMALSIKLFGPTPFAVRFVPALAGVLAVFTTYLAAAQLVVDRSASTKIMTPLVAAFVMAILFPAVHFSRFGLRAMLFVPVETLTVYFFWRGVYGGAAVSETQKAQHGVAARLFHKGALSFITAGFFLGFGLYVYVSARLFPLLFVLFIPYWFWREREALRRHWLHVGMMAAAAGLTAVPILLFFIRYPAIFLFRVAFVVNRGDGAVADKPWLTWLGNVGRVLRGLLWRGDASLRHNLPERPFLDPIQAVLFLLGILRVLRRLTPRMVFLLLWLGVMLLPSILSGDAPHFGRLVGAAPPIAIIAGLGGAALYSQKALFSKLKFERALSLKTRGWLLIAILGVSTFYTVRDYFVGYAGDPQLGEAFYEPDWEMGRYAAAQPADASLYFTPTQEEMATIYFALQDPERLRSFNGFDGLVPAGIPETPSLYLIRPYDEASWRYLTRFFAGGEPGAAHDGFRPLYVSDSASYVSVENKTEVTWDGQIRLSGWSSAQTENDHLNVTLAWQAEADMLYNYTAFVHLLDGNGRIVAQLDRQPAGYPTSDWRPGEFIVDHYRIELPPQLPPGEYTLLTGFYYLPTLERLGDAAVLTANLTIVEQ